MASDATTDEEAAGSFRGLSAREDHELRQLTWFSAVGDLSDKAVSRLWQLIGRDRRTAVREPRPNPSAPSDDDEPSRLPPLGPDRGSSLVCPNCGSLLPTEVRALSDGTKGWR
jgi:hypothetical protein